MSLFGSAPEPPKPEILDQWKGTADLAGKLSERILGRPMGVYAGDRVANMTPGQTGAIDAITRMGMAGNPLLAQTQGYASDVLSGKYLGQDNPFLQQSIRSMTDLLGRQIGGQFAGSGMAGSPANYQYLSEAFSNAAAPLLFQNYQNERNVQNQMAGMAPALDQAGYFGLNQALAAQGLLQQQGQAEINADMARYNEQVSEPMRRLQGVMGSVGSQLQPVTMPGSAGSTGLLPGALSGGMSGSLMGMATGNPYLAIGGGLLGALGGGFANR